MRSLHLCLPAFWIETIVVRATGILLLFLVFKFVFILSALLHVVAELLLLLLESDQLLMLDVCIGCEEIVG